MSSPEDFFEQADGPERDRYGRPMLIPRGGTEKQAYTRASSLSDYLADFSHLWKWKMRYLARSLGQNPDLAALAGSEPYTTGFDKGDEKDNRASGRRLDDIIERALDRREISVKADYGTVVHAVTEPGNDGNADWYGNVEEDRASFWATLERLRIQILDTEVFTANDELGSAGTFDHLMYLPGYGICITDKKTSSSIHGEDFRIQLSGYANSDVYDWETDQRMTLEELIESKGWDPALLNRHDGFIFWIKNGKTEIHRLDLTAGYEAAKVAVWVRDNHRKGKHSWAADKAIEEALEEDRSLLLQAIESADSADQILVLWNDPSIKAIWTGLHTEAAKARKEAL